jgi:hypothetical protein
MTKKGKSDTTFSLNNVNIVQLMLSRNVRSKKPIFIDSTNSPLGQGDTSTIVAIDDEASDIPITDLLHEKSKRAMYFLDTRKIQHKFWGTMIDVTENGPLPVSTSKPCWWCTNAFRGMPVGCPLKYYPNSSGVLQQRFKEKLKGANYPAKDLEISNEFFETEGYFCSFPCCKAYITDQRNNVKYKDSNSLLSLLYKIFYGRPPDFPEAPSWKLLKEYGGHYTIEEFRASFGQLEFAETVNIRRPYMFCTSQYIAEKRVKLFRGVKD